MSTVFLTPIRLECGSISSRALGYDELVCLRTLESFLPPAAERAGLAVWEVDDLLEVATSIAIGMGGIRLVPLRQLEVAASEKFGARIRIDTRLTAFNGIAA
jgi:hypothetical protein